MLILLALLWSSTFLHDMPGSAWSSVVNRSAEVTVPQLDVQIERKDGCPVGEFSHSHQPLNRSSYSFEKILPYVLFFAAVVATFITAEIHKRTRIEAVQRFRFTRTVPTFIRFRALLI
jgi:hypothetical protein